MLEGKLGKIFHDGDLIFKEGDKGDTMYVIQFGKVKISKADHEGPVDLAVLETGAIFGEMALFDRLPRSATATAVGDTRILSVDRKKFFSSINRDPTLALKILETMSERIRKLSTDFSHLKKARDQFQTTIVNTDATCNRIIETLKESIDVEGGAILLCENSVNTLNVKTWFGDHNLQNHPILSGNIMEHVMKSGESKILNDMSITHHESETMSVAYAPIKNTYQPVGIICLYRSNKIPFTSQDLKFIHSISRFAAISITNAQYAAACEHAAGEILSASTMLGI